MEADVCTTENTKDTKVKPVWWSREHFEGVVQDVTRTDSKILQAPFWCKLGLHWYRWACNGYLLIGWNGAGLARDSEPQPEQQGLKTVGFMEQSLRKVRRWVPWVGPLDQEEERCSCRRGWDIDICENCEGTGECTCEKCDYLHPCKSCKGTGGSRKNLGLCTECLGFGLRRYRRHEAVLTPMGAASARWTWALGHLSGIELGVIPITEVNEQPLVFRFDGGVGILMVMRLETDAQREGALALNRWVLADAEETM